MIIKSLKEHRKNKRGQTVFLGFVAGVMILIVGIMLIEFFKTEITTARVGLNCSNSAAISDGVKLTCLVIDITIPYFFLLILSVTGGVMVAKLLKR